MGHQRSNCPALPDAWLQVSRRCWSSSNPPSIPPLFLAFKKQGHHCHLAEPATGMAHALSWPWEGRGRKEHRAWDQGTRGRSGQLRQGDLFRDIPEGATSLLRWDTACVTALSHVCCVTPSHGLGQQSQRAQSCHLAGLHHPPPATCKDGTFRDRCHSRSWLSSAGLIADQTRHL